MNFRQVAGLLVISSSCLLAKPCAGQTAEQMLSACRPITQAKILTDGTVELPRDFESGACWGAFGMLHQVLMLLDQNGQPVLHACIPSNATRTELIAIFVRDVEQHPEEYGKDFQIVAINSVFHVYPCNQKKK